MADSGMAFFNDKGRPDISLSRLISYNLLFFVPIIVAYIIASYISYNFHDKLGASPNVCTQIFMLIFSIFIFFIIISLIRKRETVRGVRFALFDFIIVGLFLTVPSMLNGDYSVIFHMTLYLGVFIFATFLLCPDVIGISGDIDDWYKHKVQLIILFVYASTVFSLMLGFGYLYYELSADPLYPGSYIVNIPVSDPSIGTFIYYSVAAFTGNALGDFYPFSPASRMVFALEVIMGMITNVIFIAVLMMFVSFAEQKAEQEEEKKLERDEEHLKKEQDQLRHETTKIEQEEIKIEKEIEEDMRFNRNQMHYVSNNANYNNPNYPRNYTPYDQQRR